MTVIQQICATTLVLLLLYFFFIRPIIAIGDIPNSITRLTKEVEELKEVLKKRRSDKE